MRRSAYTRDVQTTARVCVYDARYMLGLCGSQAYALLQAGLGLSRWVRNIVEIEGRKRHRRELAQQIMAPVLADLSPAHPNLVLLSRTLVRLRAARIPARVNAALSCCRANQRGVPAMEEAV